MSRLLLHVSLVALLGAAGSPQTRDAAAVLADMRKALGGDAALDAVLTLSVSGSVVESTARARSQGFAVDLFVMLPGHFLHVKRDATVGGPFPGDITYYRGFRGDELIRRTDSSIPVPPSTQTPEAIARRERVAVQVHKREFARLFLVLFGKSPEAYPLQFTYSGTKLVDTRQTEVLEASNTDGFAMRLHVDRATHLPASITWQPAPDAIGRLVVSDFTLQDGLNWPRRFRELIGAQVTEDTRLGTFTINPKIDARRFNKSSPVTRPRQPRESAAGPR